MSLFTAPLTEQMFCKDIRTVHCSTGDVKFCFDQVVGMRDIPDSLYMAFANYAEDRGYSKQRSDVALYIASHFYKTFPCYLKDHGASEATCRAYANEFADDMVDATGTTDVRQSSFDWAYYWAKVAIDIEQNRYAAFAADPVLQNTETATAVADGENPAQRVNPLVLGGILVCGAIALYMILKTWSD